MSYLDLAIVVGARPEFGKAAALWRAATSAPSEEIVSWSLIHTGQHYDDVMSGTFFRTLGMPGPVHNLGVGSGRHGAQTGQMMERLEPVLAESPPDVLVVVGDTNSTLAGALVAAKAHIPVAHVEAGLRSFNPAMPEEINRRLTDHVSDLLLCPSTNAATNLAREGITHGVHVTGDVMLEALEWIRPSPEETQSLLEGFGLRPREYAVATVHRAENTNDERRMAEIMAALAELASEGLRVLLPAHPRSEAVLSAHAAGHGRVELIPPLGPREMIALASEACVGLTDSGGLQKELYWLGVPCVTMRDETEWVETVDAGWNIVAGASQHGIVESAHQLVKGPLPAQRQLYGPRDAARRMVELIVDRFGRESS